LAVGVYACLRNLFEAACYVGGGQLTARLGDRGSLILFGALTVGGYVLFLTASSPAMVVIATLLILSWEPLSIPVSDTGEPGDGLRAAVDSETLTANHRSCRRWPRAGDRSETSRRRSRRLRQRHALARGRFVRARACLARFANRLDAAPSAATARAWHPR